VVDYLNNFLPKTEQEVNIWLFYCVFLYVMFAYLFRVVSSKKLSVNVKFLIYKLYGGATFGVSSLLAPSLVSPHMVALLGDLPLHLTMAGGTGLFVALTQLNSD
jgi:hypothetical protein